MNMSSGKTVSARPAGFLPSKIRQASPSARNILGITFPFWKQFQLNLYVLLVCWKNETDRDDEQATVSWPRTRHRIQQHFSQHDQLPRLPATDQPATTKHRGLGAESPALSSPNHGASTTHSALNTPAECRARDGCNRRPSASASPQRRKRAPAASDRVRVAIDRKGNQCPPEWAARGCPSSVR